MNLKPIIVLLLLASSMVLSCAESIRTFSDRDTKTDLSKYKTYAWIAPGDTTLNAVRKDKLYGGLIVYSADQELKKKGMTVDVTAPDALFMFDTKLEEKVKYTQSPTVSIGVGYGGPGYYVGGVAPVAGGDIHASYYNDGVLVMHMYDTKTGKLIWSGGAEKAITGSTDVAQVIKTATKYIFMRLPIKHKTK